MLQLSDKLFENRSELNENLMKDFIQIHKSLHYRLLCL